MDNEIIKMSDDLEDFNYQNALINQSRDSYMTKENFIEIISKLNFDRIETANIHFITGYEYIPKNEKMREHVRTFGYDINIS